MKKHLLIAAIAITALASCSSNDFVGDESPQTSSGNVGSIQFKSNTPAITRAREGATAAGDLGYKFAVYATKTTEGPTNADNDDVTSNVFALNEYSASTNTPYWVWYVTSTANTTTSNTANWEYVGTGGTGGTEFGTESHKVTLAEGVSQTIKYWDYSAKKYDFIAYSNTGGGTVSNVTTTGFTFVGTASEFAGLYVADKLTITEKSNPAAHTTADNKIGDAVKFTFHSGAAKVRLGIYETIPGYNVKNVTFKPTSPANFETTSTNAQLSGSFNGSSSSSQTYTITYNGSGVAQFATAAAAANNFVFGTFDTDGEPYLGETSIAPTWAGASSYYINVLPNTDHTGAMVLNIDFDLYNTVTHETIHVTNAKAVVPAVYMTWNPNYAYTYLFKISDNTNGQTGTGETPAGLYPITFDAVTIEDANVSEGSITTVSTPAITTYQAGSVSNAGITYANANGAIFITVNTDGTLQALTDKIKLYKLAAADADATEADLLLAPTKLNNKEVTSEVADKLTVLAAAETSQGITFAASTSAKFTPAAGQTYAVEFTDANSAKHYKVIKVAAAPAEP